MLRQIHYTGMQKGRYEIGSISENEMLQLEVNRLNEETNVMKAQIEVEEAALTFRSFLGLREDENLEAPRVSKILLRLKYH